MTDNSYLVSNVDITRLVNYPYLKIIQYKTLYEYKTLNQLLPQPKSILAILINTAPQQGGHWVILTRSNNNLMYFDSYGKAVDDELKFVQDKVLLHEDEPYLKHLIINSGMNLSQNKIKFQKYGNNINTCGKYAIFVSNMFLQGYNLSQIQNILKSKKKGTSESYDDIITDYYNALK